jgi:hypothetical protein
VTGRADLLQVAVWIDVERRTLVPTFEPVPADTPVSDAPAAIDPWAFTVEPDELLFDQAHVAYCPGCQGEGVLDCATCGGSGEIQGGGRLAAKAVGVPAGLLPCGACGGARRVRCATCRGTTRVRIAPRVRIDRERQRRVRMVGDAARDIPEAAFEALSSGPAGDVIAVDDGSGAPRADATSEVWKDAARVADEAERDVVGRGAGSRTTKRHVEIRRIPVERAGDEWTIAGVRYAAESDVPDFISGSGAARRVGKQALLWLLYMVLGVIACAAYAALKL